MSLKRTKAIVLRRTNYGEADRILQLLTHEGKTSVIARGVRREKSKLAGGIELFAICDVVIADGKGEICTLTSSRLEFFFHHIVEDYDRLQFAYAAIKLVATASESIDEVEWYDMLAETLAGLDASLVGLSLTQTWFYLRYALLNGYELGLWQDTNGDKIDPNNKYRYDVTERGLEKAENGELDADHIKLLRLIATKPIKVLAQIGGTSDIIDTCLYVARQHAAV